MGSGIVGEPRTSLEYLSCADATRLPAITMRLPAASRTRFLLLMCLHSHLCVNWLSHGAAKCEAQRDRPGEAIPLALDSAGGGRKRRMLPACNGSLEHRDAVEIQISHCIAEGLALKDLRVGRDEPYDHLQSLRAILLAEAFQGHQLPKSCIAHHSASVERKRQYAFELPASL